MLRNKEGESKENQFVEWCRKVRTHAQPDKVVVSGAASPATEHAESPFEQSCYKSLACDLLSNEVWPQQRHLPKFQIRKDPRTGHASISREQRSWVNVLLRKNLGDSRAAYFIFNHGLPILLDIPFRKQAPTKGMVQVMVQELMTWHASLLHSILHRQKHPGMADAHKCSSKDEKAWRRRRQDEKAQAKADWREGQYLAKERDSGIFFSCLLQSNKT